APSDELQAAPVGIHGRIVRGDAYRAHVLAARHVERQEVKAAAFYAGATRKRGEDRLALPEKHDPRTSRFERDAFDRDRTPQVDAQVARGEQSRAFVHGGSLVKSSRRASGS